MIGGNLTCSRRLSHKEQVHLCHIAVVCGHFHRVYLNLRSCQSSGGAVPHHGRDIQAVGINALFHHKIPAMRSVVGNGNALNALSRVNNHCSDCQRYSPAGDMKRIVFRCHLRRKVCRILLRLPQVLPCLRVYQSHTQLSVREIFAHLNR